MKKITALLLALVLVFCSFTAALAEDEEGSKGTEDVYILYTNDIHCGYSSNTGIGYSGVESVHRSLTAQGKNVMLVDSGDAVQGDTIGTLSKGEYIVDVMNNINYDVATIGNHEFDYGMDQFNELVREAEYDYVCCNFTDAKGNPVLTPYVIKEIGGYKIAFIGIATPQTFVTSTPSYFQDANGKYIYTFCEGDNGKKLYSTVQKYTDKARADGADIVIALSHLGIEKAASPYTSSEVIQNTSGIDVFLDGHSHSVVYRDIVKNKNGEDVILTQTGTKLEHFGILKIAADGTITSDLFSEANNEFAIDTATEVYMLRLEARFDKLVNEVVAKSDVDLIIKDPTTGERIVRQYETNLGDLVTDAYRALSGADIAIVNGGGIRDQIPAGDITYGQIIKVHPFGNMMCVVKTTGQQILDALELSSKDLPSEFGGFLQVSGMHYTVDLNVESSVKLNDKSEFVAVEGDRRVKDVEVLNKETGKYEPIDPEKEYTLASHNYKLKSGGDGYTMFKEDELLEDEVMIDNQVLINYIIDKLGGVVGAEYSNPYGEGRITIIDKAA